MPTTNALPCYCSSGLPFEACCQPYLSGTKPAPTAEALMRSRYAAYVVHQMDYLEETLLPESRKGYDKNAAKEWSYGSEWLGLQILSTKGGKEGDAEGTVEFAARFKQNGKEMRHFENSFFKHVDGRWYYVDAVKPAPAVCATQAGRNDPCPCGSDKKYKKCCGK